MCRHRLQSFILRMNLLFLSFFLYWWMDVSFLYLWNNNFFCFYWNMPCLERLILTASFMSFCYRMRTIYGMITEKKKHAKSDQIHESMLFIASFLASRLPYFALFFYPSCDAYEKNSKTNHYTTFFMYPKRPFLKVLQPRCSTSPMHQNDHGQHEPSMTIP